LGLSAIPDKDIRSGTLALVTGSRAAFVPTVNRALASAEANGETCAPTGATFTTAEFAVDEPQQIHLQWKDELGLTCKQPFNVAVTPLNDEAPQIACDDLPRIRVLLDTEQLTFHVRAHDDFGIQNVGMEWHGIPSEMVEKPATGRRNLGAGQHDKSALDV